MESSERSHLATYPTSIKGVLLLDRRVLLVKNSRDEWELPGGRIDANENPAQTLSREFAEELSIDVALSAPIDSYLFEVIPGRHVFIVTYGCRLVGEFRPRHQPRAHRALSVAGGTAVRAKPSGRL